MAVKGQLPVAVGCCCLVFLWWCVGKGARAVNPCPHLLVLLLSADGLCAMALSVVGLSSSILAASLLLLGW